MDICEIQTLEPFTSDFSCRHQGSVCGKQVNLAGDLVIIRQYCGQKVFWGSEAAN